MPSSSSAPSTPSTSHEKLHAEAERARLLYVAATRARDHLVFSLFHQERTRDCAALKLIEAGAKDFADPMPPVTLSRPVQTQPFANLQTDLDGWDESTFEADRAELVTGAHVQHYTSATALGRDDRKEEREDDTEPWSRGRAGTHLGRAVHAALQTLAWDAADEEIEAVARAQTVAEAVPHMADEAATLIRVALQSEPARRALDAKRALREVPFALPHGNTILEGYVDLLIEGEDGSIEIVDWKTDHVPAECRRSPPARLRAAGRRLRPRHRGRHRSPRLARHLRLRLSRSQRLSRRARRAQSRRIAAPGERYYASRDLIVTSDLSHQLVGIHPRKVGQIPAPFQERIAIENLANLNLIWSHEELDFVPRSHLQSFSNCLGNRNPTSLAHSTLIHSAVL